MILIMDGDSCDPDANTCILKNHDILSGISAHTEKSVQVCLFVSIFKKECSR